MHFLVTGGAGFIGSNIVEELLKQGHQVRVLDNFSTGKHENIAPFISNSNFELIEGDIRNYDTVKTTVKCIDYILHQAAIVSVPNSIEDPITTNDVNIKGTLHILEAAREYHVKRVVIASSAAVYGNSEILPVTETMPVDPLSPYALSKLTSEAYCRIYDSLHGLQTVSLRYFNVFGPRQDPNSQYSGVISKFLKAISEDQQPVIYGDGLQTRDFVFVENVVRANLFACTTPNAAAEVLNIATGVSYTLLELVDILNEILGRNIKPTHQEEAKGDVKHSLASIEKAKELLGYEVKVGFEEGLRRTIEFFVKNM